MSASFFSTSMYSSNASILSGGLSSLCWLRLCGLAFFLFSSVVGSVGFGWVKIMKAITLLHNKISHVVCTWRRAIVMTIGGERRSTIGHMTMYAM